MPTWSVYLLKCADGSVYTGIATDVARRVAEHEAGPRGAKYLRGRGPFELLYQAEVGSRSDAGRVELGIKKLRNAEKLDGETLRALIAELMAGAAAGPGAPTATAT
ncbi:MAG: GIY-YIG nuclease family protein [Woeseiaceae bacterium]